MQQIDLQLVYQKGFNPDPKGGFPYVLSDTSTNLFDIMIWDSKKGSLKMSIHETFIYIQEIWTLHRSAWIWVATVKWLCEYANSCNKKYVSLSAFNAKTTKYWVELGFCPDQDIAKKLLQSAKNIITYYQQPEHIKTEWIDLSIDDIEAIQSSTESRIRVDEMNGSYFVWLLELLRKNSYYRAVWMLAIESWPQMSWIFVLDRDKYPKIAWDCAYMLEKYFLKKESSLRELL